MHQQPFPFLAEGFSGSSWPIHLLLYFYRNIAVPIATLKGVRVRAPLEELKATGTVAVQAMHARTRSDKTLTWLDGLLRVAVNRRFQQANTHVCFEAKQDLFLSVFEQR
jgi:hypothetical protein